MGFSLTPHIMIKMNEGQVVTQTNGPGVNKIALRPSQLTPLLQSRKDSQQTERKTRVGKIQHVMQGADSGTHVSNRDI